jgi:hypothetical protein
MQRANDHALSCTALTRLLRSITIGFCILGNSSGVKPQASARETRVAVAHEATGQVRPWHWRIRPVFRCRSVARDLRRFPVRKVTDEATS